MPTKSMNRRDFLKTAGLSAATAAFLRNSLARAAALPAVRRSGTIEDVEHVVVFMQENRSFDHYFGHLPGVRGYSDRFPLQLPNGKPVWFQPRRESPTEAILPFHLDTRRTSAQFLVDLDHSWATQHGAIAGGRLDGWPRHKTDMTMGYFLRGDVPFHYALADAFTICDHYFCSIAGPTCPNRAMLWTGSIDPQGLGGGPFIANDVWLYTPGVKPLAWTTYAERLQQAGITWRVYQEGLGHDDKTPMLGNYFDNALAYFEPFARAPHDSELYRRAMVPAGVDQLKKDVLAGQLPQVSWIVTPAGYSEHPSYPPAYGAIYIARVLDALTAHRETWGKTVLLLDYDENDGFFDHLAPPQPPTPTLPGISTVSTEGEVHDTANPLHPKPDEAPDGLPYGLGPRVPMLAISPWSRGGYVCSQVFDHTSVIRFLETRFSVREPNITPWRRAVCGDLTSAFDFASHSARSVSLPSTAEYLDLAHQESKLPPPTVPDQQAVALLPQEAGGRPARPLPYALELDLLAARNGVHLHFDNRSGAGICCTAYWDGSDGLPRRYTIGAGHRLPDFVPLPRGRKLAMTVYGPNGFVRKVSADGSAPLEVTARAEPHGNIRLRLRNVSDRALTAHVRDEAYGQGERTIALEPGKTAEWPCELQASHHWYDLSVSTGHHQWRLAGHVETGQESYSDPASGAPVLSLSDPGPGGPAGRAG
ncbi:MAG TPA: phospholipase C, phosphocholine-specific [Steroidobacteraceae bacterium]|nr:phospholipase C, phosphocholine-specific [Steroidobacteraceae bacterium]